jgi:hypothetical protein
MKRPEDGNGARSGPAAHDTPAGDQINTTGTGGSTDSFFELASSGKVAPRPSNDGIAWTNHDVNMAGMARRLQELDRDRGSVEFVSTLRQTRAGVRP